MRSDEKKIGTCISLETYDEFGKLAYDRRISKAWLLRGLIEQYLRYVKEGKPRWLSPQ